MSSERDKRKVALALASVYLIWGSTYLGLRFALETFPPFMLGGLRYGFAGLLLFTWLRVRGAPGPTLHQWWHSLLVGTLLFGLGNGLVAFAELTIPSGVASIVVATTSLWSVIFAALWGGRPTGSELFGLALGLAGVGLLQRGGAFEGDSMGLAALLIAAIGWAFGSIWAPRLDMPAGAMASASQMIGGGVGMLAIAGVLGERAGPLTPRAMGAFLYLVTFGSLVAFSAYRWLLSHTRPALATSYAFVNPAVALLLGALIAGEPLDLARAAACLLTATAVLFVMRARLRGIST